MSRFPRSLPALIVALAAWDASAQEPPEAAPPDPPAAPAEAASDAPVAADTEALVARMADLQARIAVRPAGADPKAEDPVASRTEASRAKREWEEAARALSKACDEYLAANAKPDPRVVLWGARGKAAAADVASREEALALRTSAAEALARALPAAKPDADYRGEAEYVLGRMLVAIAPSGRATIEDAAAHLREATLVLRKDGRLDESGRAAFLGLDALLRNGRNEAARAFSDAVGASSADFGASTAEVRVRANQVATSVGQPFPKLPDATDADGKPVRWAEFAGKPFIVHFFQAGRPTGHVAQERDVGATLRPLHDALAPKGLRMIGVSMDLALSKEKVAEIRANWDEWSRKEQVQDGSRESVRAWLADEGVSWPWIWDGKWLQNPIANALGGVGRTSQHAVLVDAAGVIRWRGDGPFQGLPEAARALFP